MEGWFIPDAGEETYGYHRELVSSWPFYDPVRATDGPIGHVAGLVIDPAGHHVTHVLLDEGHLWGRKQVAIPIRAVAEMDGGIRPRISKGDVRDLPPVELHDKPA